MLTHNSFFLSCSLQLNDKGGGASGSPGGGSGGGGGDGYNGASSRLVGDSPEVEEEMFFANCPFSLPYATPLAVLSS